MQLFIDTYGTYIHVKDQMFEILVKNNEETVKHLFSAKKVKNILIGSGIALSSDAVRLAVMNNVDIVFLEKSGQPLGRIWHSKMGSTTAIRKKQLMASLNIEGLNFIKEWLGAKLDSQIDFLKQLKKHRESKHQYIDQNIEKIEMFNAKLQQTEAQNTSECAGTLRGYEGNAGRVFFEVLSELLSEPYKFDGRSMRPAKDQFNAFLNYAYGILYSKIEKALIIAGLDPYVGYLHRDDYNHLSFVYDFIEPYRIYALETVFKLFSAKKVLKLHTEQINNGFSLNKEGKQMLVEAFNDFMDSQTIRYKGKNQTRSNTIQYDAHSYANSLIQKTPDETTNQTVEL